MQSDISKLKYVQVPTIVLFDENISSTTKLLMGLVITLSLKNGFCYASNKYLSNILKVSKRTITRCVNYLTTKGYIKVQNDENSRKIYIVKNFYTP